MSKCWYCNEELTTANYYDKYVGICTKCYNLMFRVSNEFVKGLTDKIADLEAKLAEKEKEIEYLNKQVKKFNNEAQKYYEDAYCNDFHEKDKISFAVEQLEKVRKQFDCEDNYLYGDNNIIICVYKNIFNETIDNQIKQLKEGK